MLSRFPAVIIGIAVFTSSNLNSPGDERLKRLARTGLALPPSPVRASGLLSQASSKNNREHQYKYRVLATKKTSTMEKELNEGAEEGFKFEGVMGGETASAGSEVVVVMSRDTSLERKGTYEYKLLATNKTSTMQKELMQAGEDGYSFVGMTVAQTAFGGHELVVILRKPVSR